MSLAERLGNREDQLTERKEQGVSSEIVCRTLVAFANSVLDDQTGVLFIGVADDGSISGVENVEKKQNWVIRLAQKTCYPPIAVTLHALRVEGKDILAVEVGPSPERPHFAGPAYIRVGSQSQAASERQFDELIASRSGPGRALARAHSEGQEVLVARRYPHGPYYRTRSAITAITPNWIEFRASQGGEEFSVSTAGIDVRWEGSQRMLLVSER